MIQWLTRENSRLFISMCDQTVWFVWIEHLLKTVSYQKHCSLMYQQVWESICEYMIQLLAY